MGKKRHKEIFDVVDRKGKIIGQASRQTCHSRPDLLHRVVHILVFNSEGELYLQKRSQDRDIQPGKWDTSVGGHLAPAEDFEEGAYRELEEELAVKGVSLIYLYDYVWESECESELVRTYMVLYDGPITFDSLEIEDGRFFSLREIESRLGSGFFTPSFEHEYGRYSKQDISDENSLPEIVVIRDVLDLHGFFPEQVPEMIREFIDNAVSLRLSRLRIIHGKGRSKLKYLVRRELGRHPQVNWFGDAPPESGFWGATMVELSL